MNFADTIISQAFQNFDEPGELLPLNRLFDEKIVELGITRHQAYQVLGLDKKTVDPILDQSAKTVDVLNIIKIAEFLDIHRIDKLIQHYTNNLTTDRVKEMEGVRRANFIVKHFNLDALKKAGFITSINDFAEIERKITTFFGFNSIFDYADARFRPMFSKTKRASQTQNKMLDFWILSAVSQFEKIKNPFEYDREYLKELITKFKAYSTDEEDGLRKVIRALYKAGVTVIYQPHLSTTQIRGATFVIKDKPCIVLTDLNDRYPTVWFALMHELCHVIFDFEKLSAGFHLTLDNTVGDLFLDEKIEDFANGFARDYFLSESQLRYMSPFINNPYMVSNYAKQIEVHTSLIYAFYCWNMEHKHNKKVWGLYGKYFPSAKKVLSGINVTPFDFDTLEESIIEVKKVLEP
jgi:HTH-type transcriptional regulator/antitoxin HigA